MVWKHDSPYYESSIAPYRPGPDPEPKPPQKKKQFCPACGHALASPYKYCPKCGSEVVERKSENQCSCGAIFEPGENFCFSCGKPVPIIKKPLLKPTQ